MHGADSAVWSAPVRYAEVDQQGIVFNSHYLLYCDEAMGAWCEARGLLELAERVHLITSSLTWQTPARWGEVVEVHARCARVGRSSFDMHFRIRVGERDCCTVTTTYVLADEGRPVPLPDDVRRLLT